MLVIYITRSCLSQTFSQPKRSRARLCQQVSIPLTHACMACVLSTPPGIEDSINRNSAVLCLLCKQTSTPNPHHTHQLNTSILTHTSAPPVHHRSPIKATKSLSYSADQTQTPTAAKPQPSWSHRKT
jgi:hypothetical protein